MGRRTGHNLDGLTLESIVVEVDARVDQTDQRRRAALGRAGRRPAHQGGCQALGTGARPQAFIEIVEMIEVGGGTRIDQLDGLPGLGQRGALWNAQPDDLRGHAAWRLGLDLKALGGEPGEIVARQARRHEEVFSLTGLGSGVDGFDHHRDTGLHDRRRDCGLCRRWCRGGRLGLARSLYGCCGDCALACRR